MQTFKVQLKGYAVFSYSTDDGMTKADAVKALGERFPGVGVEAVMTEQEYIASFKADTLGKIKRSVTPADVLKIERLVNEYQEMHANVTGRSYLDFIAYNTMTDLLNLISELDVKGVNYEAPVNGMIEHLNAHFNLKATRLVTQEHLNKLIDLSSQAIGVMSHELGVVLRGKCSAIVDIAGMVPERLREKLDAKGVVTNHLGMFFCKGEHYVTSALNVLCDMSPKDLRGDKPITRCRAGVVIAYSPQDMLLVVKDVSGPVSKVSDLEARVMADVMGFKAKEKLPDGTVRESYFSGDRERLKIILERKSSNSSVSMFYSSDMLKNEHVIQNKGTNVAKIDNYVPVLERKAIKASRR